MDGLPGASVDVGRLYQKTDTISGEVTLYRYDQVGNEVKSGSPGFVNGSGAPTRDGDRDQSYTASHQLRFTRTKVGYHDSNNPRCVQQLHAQFGVEERVYEYDGLGRRVLEVSPHACAPDYGVSRYFWLDDQVVVKTVNFLLDVTPVTPDSADQFTLQAEAYKPMAWTSATGVPALAGQWFVYGPGIDNVLGVVNFATGVPTTSQQMIQASTHLYLVQDERGSVVRSVCRKFTGQTGSCAGASNGGYTAFGAATNPSLTSMPGYNGHQATAGLVYMRNRWYDPNTGRFTQEDPIGYGGGSNLYSYVGNDPVNFADPFGLCGGPGEPPCKQATWALMGASGGAAIAVGGCTLSTGGVCALAAPVVAGIGGSGGALVGGFAGKIADNKGAIAATLGDASDKAAKAARDGLNYLKVGFMVVGLYTATAPPPQCPDGPSNRPSVEQRHDGKPAPSAPDLEVTEPIKPDTMIKTDSTRPPGC